MKVAVLSQRRFDGAKMQKINLFETERFFTDIYCLEPGQSQKAHVHAGADKLYAVLEGSVVARVGGEEQELQQGEVVLAPAGTEHGIENRGNARAAVLVFMAPKP
ncbi:MAG TPA: cupin domain-containing protein [Myxococcales bacterium]|nr:cupin domain-containing protein [Myxococcales bacterium]